MSAQRKCPICHAEMKSVMGKIKYEIAADTDRKFAAPGDAYICPDCGNIQQFVDLKEVKPLLQV